MLNEILSNNIDRFAKHKLTKSETFRLVDQCGDWPESEENILYVDFLYGVPLNRTEAIRAKCAMCRNGYAEGQYDCGEATCPLYPFMPFLGE